MTVSNLLAGAVIIGGAVAGGSYFYNMRRASVQLEVIPKAYIHSLSWSALTIRVDALLKNPTNARFKVKFPYIRVAHDGTLLGSSQVIDKDIQIPTFGQVVIDSMMVELPVVSIVSSAYNIIKALFEKKAIKLSAEVITTIDLGWSRIPYSSPTEITIKK